MPTHLLAAADVEFNLLAARWQMALTLGSHIILAVFGVGMPLLLVVAEWRWLVTADPVWRALARRWSKVFAVLFAVGAVSGTVLSFELGLLWPEFMARYGSVIAFPFALEGFAFFLEAIFVGIYLYGWNHLGRWAHWLCGLPIAVSGAASAWFVVTVNSWMNTPQGFRWEDGRAVDIDPLSAMLNPGTLPQTTHMLLAAYMVAGFLLASVYAVFLLRDPTSIYCRRALTLALTMAAIATPAQMFSGDWLAKRVAQVQPVKLAAMEGQFQTETGAPLRIGGMPDPAERRTNYAIEIPGMLSWLAYGSRDATVRGLDEFPGDDTPPVIIVHLAFQLMVGGGTFLFLLSLWFLGTGLLRRRLPASRLFLWLVTASGPVALASLEAGWVVTEVGRQPWIVQGFARTADMVTAAPYVGWMLVTTVTLYAAILIGTIGVLRILARQPLAETERGA